APGGENKDHQGGQNRLQHGPQEAHRSPPRRTRMRGHRDPAPRTGGERPKAFVTLHDTPTAPPEEIIAFCRERLAHYQCPDTIEFGHCRKPRPARSRSSGCATGNGRGKTSESARYSTRNLRRDGASSFGITVSDAL